MESIPLIKASQLTPFTNAIDEMGGSIEYYLERVNLPSSILDFPDAIIPERPLWQLAELVSQKEKISGFGFICSEQGAREELREIISWLRPSPSLYHALLTFCELANDVSSEAKFWLEQDEQDTLFCREGIKSIDVGRWQIEQYTFIIMLQLIRLGTGKSWLPDKVYFQTNTTSGIETTDTLEQAQLFIGQPYTAIAIPHSLLCLPLVNIGVLDTSLTSDRDSCNSISDLDFLDKIRNVVKTYLHGHYPEIDTISNALGISARTLQRRLTSAGSNYSKMIQDVRYENAISLLKDNDVKLLDITYELGYSDPAHFSRAFHRMAGISPREFRNVHTERQT